jgi:hypothetical protein
MTSRSDLNVAVAVAAAGGEPPSCVRVCVCVASRSDPPWPMHLLARSDVTDLSTGNGGFCTGTAGPRSYVLRAYESETYGYGLCLDRRCRLLALVLTRAVDVPLHLLRRPRPSDRPSRPPPRRTPAMTRARSRSGAGGCTSQCTRMRHTGYETRGSFDSNKGVS